LGVANSSPAESAETARQWDGLVWTAVQTGSWYEQSHRAASIATQGGHQWLARRWQPWLRAGYLYASGDGNPSDNRHGTFFEMRRPFANMRRSALYSQMNNTDVFAQVLAKPRPNRQRAHRLAPRRPRIVRDGGTIGSGATQERGSIFGFRDASVRLARDTCTSEEGSVDYAITPHWSITGYVAVARGGPVVAPAFPGRTLTFRLHREPRQF